MSFFSFENTGFYDHCRGTSVVIHPSLTPQPGVPGSETFGGAFFMNNANPSPETIATIGSSTVTSPP